MALGFKNLKKYSYLNFVLKKKTNHGIDIDKIISYEKHTSVSDQFVGLKKSNKSFKESNRNNIHVSSVKNYPSAPALTLPDNMIQIFGNETARFNKDRYRDIDLICQSKIKESYYSDSSITYFDINDLKDSHTECYNCTGGVSLNSSMQSNVPEPFSSEGKSTHLNMPGGESSRDDKYIAEDMQNYHYNKFIRDDNNNNNNGRRIKSNDRKDGGGESNVDIINGWWFKKNFYYSNFNKKDSIMRYSTKADSSKNIKYDDDDYKDDEKNAVEKLSPAKKLKRAVKDYGSTVIVFHVGLSLTSLGISYLVISSGIDVPNLINSLGYFDDDKMNNILSNSSTFVIAYAVHKLFAPVRISITLATTPFLVRYLRKIGILKIK